MALGSGNNTAVIYDINGARRLFTIPSQTKVEWHRVLDGISEAHVTAVPPGTASPHHQDCCDLLGRIYPWAHCLVIFRDDERVWEGPVTKVTVTSREVVIDALDVLGWLRRRPVAARLIDTPTSVLNEGEWCLTTGYAEHDPNVLAHRSVIPYGSVPAVTRDVAANSTYYADDLSDLVGSGLRYTVLGRRIILWSHSWLLGQLPTLYPSRDLADAVTFARDGMALATRVVAKNDSGESVAWPLNPADGIDLDYGLLSVIEESGTVIGADALTDIAAAAWSGTYPLPTIMIMPDGVTLNCEAAYDIQSLVPGVMIPVYENGLCWEVRQQMVLSEVKVTQGTGEDVALTLIPLTQAQATEGNTVSESITLTVTDTSSRVWTQISDDGSTAVYTAEVPGGGGGPAGEGEATGAVGWAGSATGGQGRYGAASGAVGWAGSSTGEAPAPGEPPNFGAVEGVNLVSVNDSGLETSVGNWQAVNGATVAQSAVRAHHGTKSLLATWPTGGIPAASLNVTGLTVGRTYRFTVWVYVPTGNPDIQLQVYLVTSGAWTADKDQWVRASIEFVATNTDHWVQVLPVGECTSGQVVYVDTISVTEASIRREGSATGIQTPEGGLAVTLLDSGHDTALAGTTFTTPSAVTVTAGRLYVLHVYLSGTGTSPDPTVTGPGTLVEVTRQANLAARSVVSVVYKCTAGGTGTWTWENSAAYNWSSTIWALEEWTGHNNTSPIPQSNKTSGTSSGSPPSYTTTLTGSVTSGNATTAAFSYALGENSSSSANELYDQTETGPVGALSVSYDLAPADETLTATWTTAANTRANIFEIAVAP